MVHASTLTIEILDENDLVVWTHFQDLLATRPDVHSWYDYYFIPLPDGASETPDQSFYVRLPVYDISHYIRVTLGERSGSSSCSYMICGNTSYIGDTLYSPTIELIDYSVKETDDFGITKLLRRKSRRHIDYDLIYDSGRANELRRIVQGFMGQVVLFIGDESTASIYEHLLLLGYVSAYQTIISNPVKTKATLSVEEVI